MHRRRFIQLGLGTVTAVSLVAYDRGVAQPKEAIAVDESRNIATGHVTINVARRLGPVNRMVFGGNIEAADSKGIWGDVTNIDELTSGNGVWNPVSAAPVHPVLERAKEINLSVIRYPGGSLVANYDWRKAVGPISERGDWKFGIDEFIMLCRQYGAEPLFTLSDYVLPADQMPQHLANLIEYLNAPAIPAHPWAMKRSAWGHPQPFGVRYFELGNESMNGNMEVIPHRQYSPEEYATYARQSAAAMRAVDSNIKIGIVTVPGNGSDVFGDWNRTVVRLAGPIADFLVVHFYTPQFNAKLPEPLLLQACMAAGDQVELRVQQYHEMVHKECGRTIPLAITEYNVGFVQDKPEPYRYSLAAALECADLLRVFVQPKNGILMANYWQFSNGYWGMVQSTSGAPEGAPITEKPAFETFKLWGQHFGTKLVEARVAAPTATFYGGAGVQAASGTLYEPATVQETVPVAAPKPNAGQGWKLSVQPGGTLIYALNKLDKALYLSVADSLSVRGEPKKVDYRLTFEGRFLPDPGSGSGDLGLELLDDRGWEATQSGNAFDGVQNARNWQTFGGVFNTLPDNTRVSILTRLIPGSDPISGRMEIRDIKLEALNRETFPQYTLLTASASVSQDEKTLYLIVFNKSEDMDIQSAVHVEGFHPQRAHYWEVNGANLAAIDDVRETVTGQSVPIQQGILNHVFPAHSMTAFELT